MKHEYKYGIPRLETSLEVDGYIADTTQPVSHEMNTAFRQVFEAGYNYAIGKVNENESSVDMEDAKDTIDRIEELTNYININLNKLRSNLEL